MECGVWSVACGVRRVACGVWSVALVLYTSDDVALQSSMSLRMDRLGTIVLEICSLVRGDVSCSSNQRRIAARSYVLPSYSDSGA